MDRTEIIEITFLFNRFWEYFIHNIPALANPSNPLSIIITLP